MVLPPFDLDRIGGRRALDRLVAEILLAGEEACALFARGVARSAERKPDRSPVTAADRAVELRLRAFLEHHHPHAGFLGEESGEAEARSTMRFIVDPIDGTRAFVRGLPTWSILVGLEADGWPVVGIAHFPATGDLYVGVHGGGAYGNGRPLRVSEVATLDDALVAHGSLQQFTSTGLGGVLTKLGDATHTQRGFADFDGFRRVLEGKADAMIDPGTQPWDLCPAAVLVREAGGRFTSLSGEETIFGGGALASNGLVHDAVLGLLK